jgi:hypothetical protein
MLRKENNKGTKVNFKDHTKKFCQSKKGKRDLEQMLS